MAKSLANEIDLLLDGYISQTLTPRLTEEYRKRFIKCLEKERGAWLVACDAGWVVVRPSSTQQQKQGAAKPHTTPVTGPRYRPRLPPSAVAVAGAPKLALEEEEREELFDCMADLYMGTIVPQPTWIGVSEKTGVCCPVFFVQRNGALGVSYENHGAARNLLYNAMAGAPGLLRRSNQNIRTRIQWPGYKVFHYEFRIFDRKLGKHVPIPMFRLVERVARGIHRLYMEGERDPDTFKEHWELGDNGIRLNEISVIGLLHISKGTWMPMLQLSRHVFPRCDLEDDDAKGTSRLPYAVRDKDCAQPLERHDNTPVLSPS
ncbi:hypothetical protein F5148DRAFT_219848 [Russula earlei]|uniref:Uncharacterized protein n=1 Tax=Russula earlei TaxID=71964 RepID=A0ACC0U407_9AGAM|nr:hypothetical protein F5148DRAFT_219848 [Russula earlei]